MGKSNGRRRSSIKLILSLGNKSCKRDWQSWRFGTEFGAEVDPVPFPVPLLLISNDCKNGFSCGSGGIGGGAFLFLTFGRSYVHLYEYTVQ